MKCEWDSQKNRTNIAKHGFDFSDSAEVFDLPMLVAPDIREDYDEQRFVGIGFLRQRIIVVVYAQQDDDTIRIISLRKALRQ